MCLSCIHIFTRYVICGMMLVMSEKSRRKLPILAAAVAGTLALSACANIGNSDIKDSSVAELQIRDAFITDGSTFRYDPARIVDYDGADNGCLSKVSETVIVEDQTAYISEGLGDDANGPWIGFDLKNLPNNVQEACKDDKNGVVWVVKSQVLMNETFSALTPRS